MTIKSLNEGVRSLAFGSIGANYSDVGGVTTHPIWQITVNNTTDALVVVSKDDGATDWIRLPAATSGIWEYIVKTENRQRGAVPQGTQFQVKHGGVAPTEGEISISVEYLV